MDIDWGGCKERTINSGIEVESIGGYLEKGGSVVKTRNWRETFRGRRIVSRDGYHLSIFKSRGVLLSTCGRVRSLGGEAA